MMVQYHYGIRGWREGVVLRNVTEKTRNAGVFLFYFILNEYWNYGVPNWTCGLEEGCGRWGHFNSWGNTCQKTNSHTKISQMLLSRRSWSLKATWIMNDSGLSIIIFIILSDSISSTINQSSHCIHSIGRVKICSYLYEHQCQISESQSLAALY
jgi:hypothetical protein